jgi:apolipoprotein N-acyltransferase
MKTTTSPRAAPITMRVRTFLLLAAAFTLAVLAQPKAAIPLAAWLTPIFLLQFTRSHRVLPGMLIAYLVTLAAFVLGNWNLIPTVLFYPIAVLLALLAVLPYLADRLLAPRLPGLLATLVFPLAYTAHDYLLALGPFGTWFSLAYTQYGNLPLLQLLSLTGLWGVTFLVAWLAPVVLYVWERRFEWRSARVGALLYTGILALVFIVGSLRLAYFPPSGATVRVAGISPSPALMLSQAETAQAITNFYSGRVTQADLDRYRQLFARLDDDLFSRSLEQAQAGAKIIVWTETGAPILQGDEATLIARGQRLAQQQGVYLDMGIAVVMTQPPYLADEAVLVDPSGGITWRYQKAHPVPGMEMFPPGDGVVPVVRTSYGQLANVICFDADFQGLLRVPADLMLVPSNDWPAIDPLHSQMAAFRAIENGYSLVRSTSNGLSLAVDYEGRVAAATDFYTTDDQVIVAYLPTHGVRTPYAVVGDLFAWICLAILLALLALVAIRRPRPATVFAADTAGSSLLPAQPTPISVR